MRCPECESPLMPTVSGSVCPAGCGKLHPPLARKAKVLNLALLAGIGQAQQTRDHWVMDFHGTELQVSPGKALPSHDTKKRTYQTVAIFDGVLREAVPVLEIDRDTYIL